MTGESSTLSEAEAARQVAHHSAEQAAVMAIDAALEKKALMPIVIDVSETASYTDFIAVVSGRSERQVDAIAEHVASVLKKDGRTQIGREGRGNGKWTLLDFGDVIIHIFLHPVREIYDIEGLWFEAPRLPLENVPDEAMQVSDETYYAH